MGSQISPDTPTISLPQGKLVGVKLNDSLPQPVDGWMGVPYALPPTGDLRFRLPVKVPASPDKVIDASEYGPAAPGKGLLVGPTLEQSEDCLTANIFRKSADKYEKLPVALYIHGGAFNRGSAHMHKTASMVANAPEAFVAVTFQYRIGALGFLPSSLSAKEGVLNLGLKDQILMMEWVQENIAAFGGDPSNVTLFGLSAGAHSIGHHIMHYNEGVAPLFHKAIIESGAPTSRAVRPYNAPIHEAQFKDFLHAVGVPEDLPENEIFPFLRQQPEKVITDAQTATFDKYNPSLRWAFQPVIDGEVIARPPLETWKSGKWHKVPIMTGFTTNEGSLYVSKQMSESSQFRHFWAELLPLLTSKYLDTIEELYRDPAKFEDSEYKETRKDMGSQYKRIEAAYAHYAYVAPARQTAELASPSVPVYLYHWAAVSTVNNGAQHADNMRYEVCDPKVIVVSETQKDLAKTLNHYVTSFITRDDPNAVPGEYPQRPKWEAYDPKSPKVLRFGEGNEELIGGDAGKTAVFTDDDWARKQSEFWWSKVDISQQ
ncbi:triacylglycerol lipase [Fusarium proliferatum]|uniref:Carboxylic ester hydrolase n=1 Tax=Gibberella intermedia TaxID=948311 RepID=A0A365NAP2_GIBIN|nr:triacylglycerol lipase [Fusarium proliferatum]